MAYKLEKVKILIVDDMQPMLDLTKSVLKIFGFKLVFTAPNAEEAFEIVCKEDPDLIITDWMMSPVDGLEFAKQVRRDPLSPNPYVPVLMMTGFSARFRVENARDAGITEFMVKPFSARDLYKRVVQIVERPRQFVEAGEFFGPDRRRKSDENYEGPRRRERDKLGEEKGENADILKKLQQEARNVSS